MPPRFHCTFLGALSSLQIAALILILPGTKEKREAGALKTVPGQGKKKEKKKTHAHLRPGSAAAGWNNSPSDVTGRLLKLSQNGCGRSTVTLELELWCDGSRQRRSIRWKQQSEDSDRRHEGGFLSGGRED